MSIPHIGLAGYFVAPPSAPSIAAGTASGGLGVGNYSYKMTFTTLTGETSVSAASNVTTTGTGSMNLTLPVGTTNSIQGRKLYRTTSGGSSYLFLATLNNVQTTYTDLLADGSLGSAAPTANTATIVLDVTGVLSAPRPMVLGSANTTATGTTIADAAQLPSTVTVHFVAGADAAKGVLLPSDVITIGQQVIVVNTVAAILKVYPATATGIIDGGGAGVNIAQAASVTRKYVVTAISPVTWVSYI